MPSYTRQRRITPYTITATNLLSPECLLPTSIFAEWVDRALREKATSTLAERLARSDGIEVIPDLKLKLAVQKVLDDNSITNRNELDNWVKLNGGTLTAPMVSIKKSKTYHKHTGGN